MSDLPITCDVTAMDAGQRQRYGRLREQMQTAAESIVELPDGYAIRYPMDPGLFLTLAEFITLERLCCPFLHLTLTVEPQGGPAWLRLTGGRDVKALLQSALNETC